jgi:hypothetical protein
LAGLVRERVAAGRIDEETHFIARSLAEPEDKINSAALYSDPTGRPPPSLLAGLMRQPTTRDQQPIENQFSEALSFLTAWWPRFASRLAQLCGSPEDQQLRDAVTAAEVIGARTRVSLPVLNAGVGPRRGFLFPDVSIEGSERTFQILLEVKVTADLHTATVGGRELLQPDAYAAAWRRLVDPAPARTRRVSTLTREPLDLHDSDPLRKSSLTWAQVVELLEEEEQAGVPQELAVISADLRAAVSELILPPAIDPAEFAYLSGVADPLLDGFASIMLSGYPGSTKASAIRREADFIRRYMYLEVEGRQLQLLVRLSPSGGRYNLPGRPSTVALQFMTDSNETLPSEFEPIALGAGMQPRP